MSYCCKHTHKIHLTYHRYHDTIYRIDRRLATQHHLTARNWSCIAQCCLSNHTGLRKFGIDQECVDRMDPADIQAHLGIMHRVYEESGRSVVPLSFTETERSLLEILISYLYDDASEYGSGRGFCAIFTQISGAKAGSQSFLCLSYYLMLS